MKKNTFIENEENLVFVDMYDGDTYLGKFPIVFATEETDLDPYYEQYGGILIAEKP
ncbi:MAG: hypothetical protein IJB36_01375 [Clostridia bacterium]|nr:hypothetical protein [Clostridia bacterium]